LLETQAVAMKLVSPKLKGKAEANYRIASSNVVMSQPNIFSVFMAGSAINSWLPQLGRYLRS